MLRVVNGRGQGETCSFCGYRDKHTEECRQNWRDIILAYPSKEN